VQFGSEGMLGSARASGRWRLRAACCRTLTLPSRASSSSSASSADAFHDSQSGLLLARPRRDVLRVHELALSRSPADAAALRDAAAPSPLATRELSLALALALALDNNGGVRAARSAPRPAPAYSAEVRSEDELAALASCALARAGLLGASISVHSRTSQSFDLLRRGVSEGVRFRAVVVRAVGCDLDASEVEDVVALLADAGASVVTLAAADDGEAIDADEVREAVERAHNLDVAGDAMLERVCFRGSAEACAEALRAGVTRVEAHSGRLRGVADAATVLRLASENGRKVVLG
jgi:hypothetical protein